MLVTFIHSQIPRLDISSPANAVEYHPALLAHLDENNSSNASDDAATNSGPSGNKALQHQHHQQLAQHQPIQGAYLSRPTTMTPLQFSTSTTTGAGVSTFVRKAPSFSESEVSCTDESDGEGGSGDYSYESSDDDSVEIGNDEDIDSAVKEEKVEREDFGFEYKGEKLSDNEAQQLLVLIEHASTCPGR